MSLQEISQVMNNSTSALKCIWELNWQTKNVSFYVSHMQWTIPKHLNIFSTARRFIPRGFAQRMLPVVTQHLICRMLVTCSLKSPTWTIHITIIFLTHLLPDKHTSWQLKVQQSPKAPAQSAYRTYHSSEATRRLQRLGIHNWYALLCTRALIRWS